MKKAFSTLEMILVVAVLSIALGFAFIFHQSSQIRSDLNTQTSLLVAQLRLAHSNAVAGNTTGPRGVHLELSSYTLFREGAYDPQSPFNEVVTLPPTLTITQVSLAGNGADIVFSSPLGETTSIGSFRLSSAVETQFNQITITSLGTIY